MTEEFALKAALKISLSAIFIFARQTAWIVVGEFKAENFDELFDGIKAVEWEKFIPEDGKIIVSAKSVMSKLFAYSAIQSISKKSCH